MKNKFLLLALFVIFLLACTTTVPIATPASPQEGAWRACLFYIQTEYKASYNDAQEYDLNNVDDLGDHNYKVSIFYEKLGYTYICELQLQPDGKYKLINLEAE